jgi:hypothetical protein
MASLLGDVPSSNQVNKPQAMGEIAVISVGAIAILVTCVAILSYFRTGRKGRKSPKSLHARPSYFDEKGVVGFLAINIQVNPNPEATSRQGRMISAKKGKQGRSWR